MPSMDSLTPKHAVGRRMTGPDGKDYIWKGGNWIQEGTQQIAKSNIAQQLNTYVSPGEKAKGIAKGVGRVAGRGIVAGAKAGMAVTKGAATVGAATAAGAAHVMFSSDPEAALTRTLVGGVLGVGAGIKSVGKSLIKGIKGGFSSSKEKKEHKKQHDTLHEELGGGSPSRQAVSEKSFNIFSTKFLKFIGKGVKDSNKETQMLEKEERQAKEDAAEG